ncbi:MAG: T9SS type A sorting domain-containing protein [Bacteroidales bacterium]|nr:T9SS type A sorting domain-containing protein [Bacteroidales bacterium]
MKKYLLLTGVIIVFHCAYSQCDFSGQVPRYTLIEGFTSCSSPHSFNGQLNLQNVLTQNDVQDGKYTLIKYQMNWPSSGDPYYTLEGAARRNFYDVTILPWLHVDGSGENELLFTNNQLVDYQNILSCIEVKGNFSVEDKTVNAIIHITPTVDINESNDLRLFIAIVEKITHKNTCNSGQNTFVQVMKKFMPDADGIELGNLTENQTIIKEQTWEFKGNYCMPYPGYIINHDIEHSVENFDNLEVVAWVQNIATKEVYNSCTATKGALTTFVVDYDVIGGNGSLSATVNGTPINSGDMVNTGETVDFTATPNQNYIVKEWKLNDIVVSDNTTDNYSVIVDKAINVTVEFMLPTFVVDYDVISGNGSLSATINGSPINSGDMVNIGETVDFTATPNQDYIVKEWKLNDIVVSDNTTDNHSVIVDKAINVTVEFMLASNIATNNLVAVELFPNPVTNELYISNTQQVKNITIANMTGQTVIEALGTGNKTMAISTQYLPSGIFFVTLKNREGFQITKKLVKK